MKGCTADISDITDIKPQACEPVSKDKCKSGYMAKAENINTPEDSMDLCCKCNRNDDTQCEVCLDPEMCTQEEADLYYTDNNDCFKPQPGPSPSGSPLPGVDSYKKESGSKMTYIYALICIIILVLGLYFYSNRQNKY